MTGVANKRRLGVKERKKRDDYIVKCKQSGITYEKISASLGVHVSIITKVLRERGV